MPPIAAARTCRIAIVGSRLGAPDGLPSGAILWYIARSKNVKAEIDAFINALPERSVIVSGGAPYVDSFAEAAALRRFGPDGVSIHRADWRAYGKRAGFLRNPKIVADCTELHAWWDGLNRGTAHTIGLAREAGKPVTIHPVPAAPPGAGEKTNRCAKGMPGCTIAHVSPLEACNVSAAKAAT